MFCGPPKLSWRPTVATVSLRKQFKNSAKITIRILPGTLTSTSHPIY